MYSDDVIKFLFEGLRMPPAAQQPSQHTTEVKENARRLLSDMQRSFVVDVRGQQQGRGRRHVGQAPPVAIPPPSVNGNVDVSVDVAAPVPEEILFVQSMKKLHDVLSRDVTPF